MALYDTFLKGVVNKEFTAHKKEEFLKMVKGLDTEGIKTFLLIVKFHDIRVSQQSSSMLPYGSHIDEKGVTFDLDKFPSLLQNILYKFMEMYIKNKQIELERQMFNSNI